MKILFVSALLPYPLYSGGQIRMYNLLKRLSKDHEIHLFSFIRHASEKANLPQLSFCKTVTTVHRGRGWQPKYLIKSIAGPYPLLWEGYHNSEMLSVLSDEIAQGDYDLIHIEPGYVWPSVPTEHRVPIVITEHNVEHAVYDAYARAFPVYPLRPFLSLDVVKMIRWEKKSWAAAAGIVSVSAEDKAVIGESVDPKRISVVPNGVDIKEFAFRPKKTFARDRLTFLYVGNFRWMENKDAAQHLITDFWPTIREKYSDARLRIVGKNAPSGPYFVGSVDNIQDELNAADIMLAPIRIGGGTKYKILEAMASGLPVITSPLGTKGMKGEATTHFLLAENSADILGSIAYLLNDSTRMRIVNSARQLIEKEYSWDLIAQKLDRVWKGVHEH